MMPRFQESRRCSRVILVERFASTRLMNTVTPCDSKAFVAGMPQSDVAGNARKCHTLREYSTALSSQDSHSENAIEANIVQDKHEVWDNLRCRLIRVKTGIPPVGISDACILKIFRKSIVSHTGQSSLVVLSWLPSVLNGLKPWPLNRDFVGD
jgi:hypothetical protein